MPMTFVKPEELDSYIGKSLEPSEWLTIDQERINNFADATKKQVVAATSPEARDLDPALMMENITKLIKKSEEEVLRPFTGDLMLTLE